MPRSATMARSPITNSQKQFFQDEGYLILKGFFKPARVKKVKSHVDELWSGRSQIEDLVIDAYIGSAGANYRRTLFKSVEDKARAYPYKLNDLHLVDPIVQDIVADGDLVAILGELLTAVPMVCNTLLFERGSEQGMHFDTFYMPSKTPNMMAASWVAIDPVVETNGPLFYYPKSHLIEPYKFSNGSIAAVGAEMPGAIAHMEHIVEKYKLKREVFFPKAGDVLIWHAQLLHGGSPIANPEQTRTSLVTHYWTELDYPDESDKIVLGEGRYMLRKSHQQLPTEAMEIDAFLSGLAISAKEVGAVPAGFDPRGYLAKNPDVFQARANPYTHYLTFGHNEGRQW